MTPEQMMQIYANSGGGMDPNTFWNTQIQQPGAAPIAGPSIHAVYPGMNVPFERRLGMSPGDRVPINEFNYGIRGSEWGLPGGITFDTHDLTKAAMAAVGIAGAAGALGGNIPSGLSEITTSAAPLSHTPATTAALNSLGYTVAPASAGMASFPFASAIAGTAGVGGAIKNAAGIAGAAEQPVKNVGGMTGSVRDAITETREEGGLFGRISNYLDGLPSWLGDVIGGAGTIIGANQQSDAISDSINAQTEANQRALDFLRESRDMAMNQQRPALETSNIALARLLQMTGNPIPSGLTSALGEAGINNLGTFDMQQDPSYQFRLNQGMEALQNSAAARGQLNSGAFARSALQFAQDYASTEYTNIYNRLSNLAGYGQVAGQVSANAATNFGNVGSGIMQDSGNARSSGYTARGNIWGNAINQIAGLDWSSIFGG